MGPQPSTVEGVIARLASKQHGVVTRVQLLRAGVTVDEIRGRVRAGALLRVHRGVYRAGHRAPSVEADYLAAVLACGDGARLSGRAAAYLLGLVKGRAPAPEVTAPRERRVDGVRVRRGRIDPADRATHRGIPVTAVPRTLIDLAAGLPLDALARACHEAGVRHRITPAQLASALARRPPTTPGAAKLRRIVDGDARVTLSRSSAGSSNSSASTNCPCRGRTAPPAPTTSTADRRTDGSRSSSTATASTTRVTRGSRTGGASAMRARAATSSAGTPGRTSSSSRPRCSPSCVACSTTNAAALPAAPAARWARPPRRRRPRRRA